MNSRTTNRTPRESRKGNRISRCLYKENSTLKLDDPKSLIGSVKMVLACANIKDEFIVSTIISSVKSFYKDFSRSSVGLGTSQLCQHFDACKRRCKLLEDLDRRIQSSSTIEWEEYGIFRRTVDGSYSPFKSKWENRLTFSYLEDGEVNEFFEIKIHPKCYKALFLGLYMVIEYLGETLDETSREEYDRIIHVISPLFVSVGMLYTQMRATKQHARDCVDRTVSKIESDFRLDPEAKLYKVNYSQLEKGVCSVITDPQLIGKEKSLLALEVDPMSWIRIGSPIVQETNVYMDTLFNTVKADIISAMSVLKEAQSVLPATRQEWMEEHYPKNLRYVLDIASAAVTVDFRRKYDPSRDDYISMKSSGTQFKGRSLPALYASLVEVDRYKEESSQFDEFIGYKSDYRSDVSPNVHQSFNCIKSVEPPAKIDTRAIFINDNPQQDRFNWFHNILMDVLENVYSDCTKNQMKSKQFVLKRTETNYRMEHHNSVYTLDISDATNTCSLEFQEKCLSIFFDEVCVQWWHTAVSHEAEVYYPGESKPWKRKVTRKKGQPQGALSSFPAFALMHHIVYLMTIKAKEWTRCRSSSIYCIIGDDSASSTIDADRDLSFRNTYIQVCAWMGWEVNPLKGYSALADTQIAFAEIAKTRILNGRVNTPIPSRLLIRGDSSPTDTISLAKWFSENYLEGSLDIETVIENSSLSQRVDDYKVLLRKVVACLPSDAFKGLNSSVEFSDEEEALITLLYFEQKLEGTLISCLLPEHHASGRGGNKRDNLYSNGHRSGYSHYGLYSGMKNFHLSGEFWNDPFVQSSTSTKYLRVYNECSDLIHLLENGLGYLPFESECVVALKLSNKERYLINELTYQLVQFRNALKEGTSFYIDIHSLRHIAKEVFSILDRFQDRSDVRRNLNSSFFADDIINKIMEDANMLEHIILI